MRTAHYLKVKLKNEKRTNCFRCNVICGYTSRSERNHLPAFPSTCCYNSVDQLERDFACFMAVITLLLE